MHVTILPVSQVFVTHAEPPPTRARTMSGHQRVERSNRSEQVSRSHFLFRFYQKQKGGGGGVSKFMVL